MWKRLVTANALLVVAASGGQAQTYRGTLRVSVGDTVVANARVWLVSKRGATVDTARSNDRGRFELRAPKPGEYRLVIRRLGYVPEHTSYIALRANEVRDDVINLLWTRLLPTVEVVVGRDTRRLFGLRPETLGKQFVRPEEVEKLLVFSNEASDLIRHANFPGVELQELSGGDTCVRIRMRTNGCATIYLDGLRLGDILPPLGAKEIESFVVLKPLDSVLVPGGGAIMLFTRR